MGKVKTGKNMICMRLRAENEPWRDIEYDACHYKSVTGAAS